MPEPLVDTSVCIDYLRGNDAARGLMLRLRGEGRVRLHAVVIAELYEGMTVREESRRVDALVEYSAREVPTAHDFASSLALFRRHRPSHGVGWHDCLLAASGIRLGVPVLTLNDKHFRIFKGLTVIRPY